MIGFVIFVAIISTISVFGFFIHGAIKRSWQAGYRTAIMENRAATTGLQYTAWGEGFATGKTSPSATNPYKKALDEYSNM